jgi:uncharacterized protein YqeY
MELKEKIQEDLKKSQKERDELKVSVLRLLLSSVLNKEKEKRYKVYQTNTDITEKELSDKSRLTDEEILEVISSEIKKRREAALEFEKGRRQELAEKEKKEMEILKSYLPAQMSEEEIRKLVKDIISKVGAKEQKDMGRVMAQLMPKVKGKADGSLVSGVVKELLSGKIDYD